MKNYLLFLGIICLGKLAAQEPLSIQTKNHCAFLGNGWEEELYLFESNQRVESWIKEILELGGATKNFDIIQTNVENVAAVFDPASGKRYLLYSPDYIEKAGTKLEVYAALSHEIGHHANEHTLTEDRRIMEEMEAHQFMGYVLAKTKAVGNLVDAQRIIDKWVATHPDIKTNNNQKFAFENGWKRAEKLLNINSAGFDNDPQRAEFLKAAFEVRPCCSPFDLPKSLFSTAKKLGDIAQSLNLMLDKKGYYYRSYMSYKGGFALVTQMEQFNEDFTFRNDQNRWSAVPVGESFSGFLDYFKRMMMPSKSNFRTFVFVVTAQGFSTQEGGNVSKDEAQAWFRRGFNKLPPSIAALKITEGVSVMALVYEFQVPEANRKPNQKCPSIDTKRHLEQSGLFKF